MCFQLICSIVVVVVDAVVVVVDIELLQYVPGDPKKLHEIDRT